VSGVVSINGVITPPERAVVSVFDRGFLYGDGVFETLRAYRGKVFAKEEHLARLGRSAAALRITLPVSQAELGRELDEAIEASHERDAYARVVVTRGVTRPPALVRTGDGGAATRVVLVEPLRLPPRDVYVRGLRAITLAWGRATDPSASAKALPYVTNLLALDEARARGADEALFVGADGALREAATANVFVVDADGTLVTPSEGPGVLGGITRGHVIDLACTLGFSCAVRHVPREAFARAREMFLTSSVREIVSVVAVDGAPVGAGTPGEVTRTLHAALRVRAGASGPLPWE